MLLTGLLKYEVQYSIRNTRFLMQWKQYTIW